MNVNENFLAGIVGIDGLRHMGIKLAKAFGAKVVAITRTPEKLQSSISLGADDSVMSSDNNK